MSITFSFTITLAPAEVPSPAIAPPAAPVASQLAEVPRPAPARRPLWRQLCWEWARERCEADQPDGLGVRLQPPPGRGVPDDLPELHRAGVATSTRAAAT